ncbi:MAG TPA: hypothetical protein VJ917_01490 [Saprospiraceae bacterium]|nr:hypothetical protein [Saprospiraceae bacterium]
MIKKYYLVPILLLLHYFAHAQSNYFFGVIRLEGLEDRPISYILQYDRNDNELTGHSLTDLLGRHETKNHIEGTILPESGTIQFQEKDIIYTKSKISDESFCFIDFEGELIDPFSDRPRIKGNFKGFYGSGEECARGSLDLVGSEAIKDVAKRASNKIQKSKKVPDSLKIDYDLNEFFDSLHVHNLGASENLNLFASGEEIIFDIWDSRNEDGDIINVYHNERLLLDHFSVKNKKFKLEVKLEEAGNVFRIEALNQGSQGLNTAMIEIQDERSVQFRSNLKKGEYSQVTVIRKTPSSN